MSLSLGIDVGSTTVKVVLMKEEQILFSHYERHMSQVREKTAEILQLVEPYIGDRPFSVAVTGSAGFGLAKAAGLSFVQEVYATGGAVRRFLEEIDVVIELGGEDAKILFLTGGREERMNGSCAGGTGAFIDQMAVLMNVTVDELDALSLKAEKIYPIASHCGVFAKTDIQPLLNQNARKEDIAASIYQAVVDQTVIGLAQGRRIKGRVAFLGGPLYFSHGLKKQFQKSLELSDENAVFPENGQFFVAAGAALYAAENEESLLFSELIEKLALPKDFDGGLHILDPLFRDKADYEDFCKRHAKASVPVVAPADYSGRAYLGIDCGSTTIKVVLIGEHAEILYQFYGPNNGNPLELIRKQLLKLAELCEGHITICGAASTGYGEALMKSAFHLDFGLVETLAHFRATRHFSPQVDFILDIGGQDIKCMKIKDNAIDSIMLNEACSSGCGSFLETFARSLGYTAEEFARLGLFAERPVDLGSRCTVFMNSSVKQAQKDGAGVEDISAGLCISVIKNAIYKVIRARDITELGEHVVVQGGTFYNDAVLRSFEQELGRDVVRPSIAGLMGAFGAALYAREKAGEKSSLLSKEELSTFSFETKEVTCGLCQNKCRLTVNIFPDGSRYLSGNKCERPNRQQETKEVPNLYEYKRKKLAALSSLPGKRGKIGIPLGLNFFETLPFWHAFFTELGYEVVLSDASSPQMYRAGRYSIPSDTVCYPAKLMHGHIENLLDKGIKTIFYPCMTYNFDEKKGDNHFNCPVVAYYPELLHANVERLEEATFLYPFFGLHNPRAFQRRAYAYFHKYDDSITRAEIQAATKKAYSAHAAWQGEIKKEGERAIRFAKEHGLDVIVLCGRPYHVDAEINHGIDRLITSLGVVVLSEDCVCDLVTPPKVQVLNQWTYHSRLYSAAEYCARHDAYLVQLVSFGCGIDAITTDEVRDILESRQKLYTQIKIDDIHNLGAVKIRIRSLLGAARERKEKAQ
ncbi:MAG: 2-hydroxyglutaryl-CoA dehydratase [Ruminococcaceae bacterium]|nr:2-hydroxyglutaryl-CoA dehydratase [Oscillospiraceae bacterium]